MRQIQKPDGSFEWCDDGYKPPVYDSQDTVEVKEQDRQVHIDLTMLGYKELSPYIIEGFYNRYLVSSNTLPNGATQVYDLKNNSYVAAKDEGDGSLVVDLSNEGVNITIPLEDLVAINFVPKESDSDNVVIFKDGDMSNTNYQNLDWA